MKKFTAAVAAALLAIVTLSGCSAKPADVVKPADSSAPAPETNAPETEAPAEDPAEEPADAEEPQAEESAALKIGDTVKVGDWEVTITKVTKNANKAIKKANMFNDDPEGQYVLIDYKAKYVGEERKANAQFDLRWSFTDAAQNVLDETFAVSPADAKDKTTEARKGGTITQQVVFDVDKKLIDGGMVSVENFSEYADFPID